MGMCYLISYDVSNPKRLRHVCKVLESYGTRVQRSVFECHLPPPAFSELWGILQRTIKPEEDSLLCYPLDATALGHAMRAGKEPVYIAGADVINLF